MIDVTEGMYITRYKCTGVDGMTKPRSMAQRDHPYKENVALPAASDPRCQHSKSQYVSCDSSSDLKAAHSLFG
jgi:hypothetical protein